MGAGVPVRHVPDCNDVVAEVLDAGPDLLLSVNVYQRMHQPLLDAPRVAALNCHFGMLPQYRGMSPVIWALSRGEDQIGVTVHRMVLDFDEGALIRQEPVDVEPGESVFHLTRRACRVASTLLLQACLAVVADPAAGRRQEGEGSYFSLPTRDCIRQLYDREHRLWQWSDFRA